MIGLGLSPGSSDFLHQYIIDGSLLLNLQIFLAYSKPHKINKTEILSKVALNNNDLNPSISKYKSQPFLRKLKSELSEKYVIFYRKRDICWNWYW